MIHGFTEVVAPVAQHVMRNDQKWEVILIIVAIFVVLEIVRAVLVRIIRRVPFHKRQPHHVDSDQ